MEQAFVDGIVVIHGGWRIVLVSLIECHKEHIQLLLRQPLYTLTDSGGFQKIQGNQQLVTGIGAVQIQRAIEAQVNRFINKVNLFVPISEQFQQFTQENRAVRKGIEAIQHFVAAPILCRLAPDGDIEHLQHSLLQFRQHGEIYIVQPWKQIEKERDPAAGINDSQPCKGFRQDIFHRFLEIRCNICSGAQAREGRKLVNRSGVQMVVVQEIAQSQFQTGVIGKGGNPGHQPSRISVGGTDVVENISSRFLFQLNIAALGYRN